MEEIDAPAGNTAAAMSHEGVAPLKKFRKKIIDLTMVNAIKSCGK